jgi:hypothetical protein
VVLRFLFFVGVQRYKTGTAVGNEELKMRNEKLERETHRTLSIVPTGLFRRWFY